MFSHTFAVLPAIKEVYINGKRHYQTPEGNVYPSLTTVLGHRKSPALEAWKKAVGEKEATTRKITTANRGQILHGLCEAYLKNEQIDKGGLMPDSKTMFASLVPWLDAFFDITSIEGRMYSDRLKIGGRCDVIAKYGKKHPDLAVIDIKTLEAQPELRKDVIEKYFIQCTGYSQMFQERTGLSVPIGILLIVSLDNGVHCLIRNLKKFEANLEEIVSEYYKENLSATVG